MTSSADAAMRYAAAGFEVLPLRWIEAGRCSCGDTECSSPAKHPMTKHGKDDASIDPDVIRRWWRRWPDANVGIRPPRGLIVCDEDPRHGGDLDELSRQHGPIPGTLTARTGSGGRHLWLRHDGPVPGKIGPGIDVKSNAGYVVAAPSLHESGQRYRWIERRAVAAAPTWLRALLSPPPRPVPAPRPADGQLTSRAVAGVLRVVLEAPDGGRNNALSWASWRLYQRVQSGQLSELAAEALLADAAAEIRLPEREARSTMASARRKVLG